MISVMENYMDTVPQDQQELLIFMRTLADADRMKIAGLLGVEKLTISQIAERLGMKPGEVAHHVDLLISGGLAINEGNAYRLDSPAMEKLSRRMLAQSHPPVQQYEGDEYEVKTLRSYLSSDGTLKSIPAQHKKLMVILKHLANSFEPGVHYPESQVNQILRPFHEDTASLRRYLVDNGLLQREKSIYWKVDSHS